MLSSKNETAIIQWLARQEIAALSTTYMRGQDRLDPALHRSVFWDDAHIDYGFFKGGPDEFVAFAQGVLGQMDSSHHLIGQTDISVADDVGSGEIYYIAYHRIVNQGRELDLFVSGRYLDRYERRGEVWKISYRSEIIDWIRESLAGEGEFMKQLSKALRGKRGSADRSYQLASLR